MKIKLNGKIRDDIESVSIIDLLREMGLQPGEVVVQHNGIIIKKDNLTQVVLKNNDELEILHFVGGG